MPGSAAAGAGVGQAGRVVAGDYAWAIESHELGLNFCLTFVRGLGPDEVIARLGGADPVSIASAGVALAGFEAVHERVDDEGAALESGLDYVAVTRAGDWTMVIEPNGFFCTYDEAIRNLSVAGEMVSFYFNENTTPRFTWAVGGAEVVGFDPGYPADRDGSDPGRLDGLLSELGFTLGDAEDFDDEFRERTLALMERITGVRWDAAFLEAATFRCAGVGGPGGQAVAQPWYAEVREALAAYAADPEDWDDDSLDKVRWRDLGVTDQRIIALGNPGMRVFDSGGPGLVLMIACAPAELLERMAVWARDRPFRLAGVRDEPWFAAIRDRVRRREPLSEAEVRVVEERLDAYLRTVSVFGPDSPDTRHRIARALVTPHLVRPPSVTPPLVTPPSVRLRDASGPAVELCMLLGETAAAEGGWMSRVLDDLRNDFPELAELPIPPAAMPPERPAARRKREARERQAEEWRLADRKRTWGGRIPGNARLSEPEVQAHTLGLVPYDRDLIDRIADAAPPVQRAMAVWAARHCCTSSGLIARDWARAGVLALERGDPPPTWFADFDAAFARLFDVPRESLTHRSTVTLGDREPPRINPAVLAIHTVVMARHDDPLIAAMDTVRNAFVLDDDPGATRAAARIALDRAEADATSPGG